MGKNKGGIFEAGRTEQEQIPISKYLIDDELVSKGGGGGEKLNKAEICRYLSAVSDVDVEASAKEAEELPGRLCDEAKCCDVVLMSEWVCVCGCFPVWLCRQCLRSSDIFYAFYCHF